MRHSAWEKANGFRNRHLVLILCIVRYSLSYITFNYYSGWARFTYRLSFLSAALTYGIVVYKTWRARQKVGAKNPGPMGIVSDENVQYLGTSPSLSPPLTACTSRDPTNPPLYPQSWPSSGSWSPSIP